MASLRSPCDTSAQPVPTFSLLIGRSVPFCSRSHLGALRSMRANTGFGTSRGPPMKLQLIFPHAAAIFMMAVAGSSLAAERSGAHQAKDLLNTAVDHVEEEGSD